MSRIWKAGLKEIDPCLRKTIVLESIVLSELGYAALCLRATIGEQIWKNVLVFGGKWLGEIMSS